MVFSGQDKTSGAKVALKRIRMDNEKEGVRILPVTSYYCSRGTEVVARDSGVRVLSVPVRWGVECEAEALLSLSSLSSSLLYLHSCSALTKKREMKLLVHHGPAWVVLSHVFSLLLSPL